MNICIYFVWQSVKLRIISILLYIKIGKDAL
jgi:hypothetical protein